MVWLVFETFVVMLVFVAAGIVLGIGLKHLFGGGAEPVAAGAGVRTVPATERAVTAQRPAPVAAAGPATTEPVVVEAAAPPADPVAAEGATLPAIEAVIDPAKAAAADQVGARPSALAGPRDGVPDDLKRIKGIGPQNEARLNALGIFHFDQIAGWTVEESRWVGSYLAFPGRIEREDWGGQARGLAGPG